MKKILAVLLALAMVFTLAACGQKEEAKTEKEIEIAVVLKCSTSEYWGYVQEGCEQAGKDLGVKVTVIGPNAESDIEPQVAMIEQQIGAGCSAIVVAPNDAAAAQAALKPAIEAGIPVLAVDTNVGIEGQTCFVGTMNDVAAYQGGQWALQQLGSDAKAVIIYGQEGDNTSNLRKEGWEKACKEAGVEVLDAISGQNTIPGAVQAMEDLLNKHGDAIKVVFCHNDDSALGAAEVCKNAGYTKDDIFIVGFDGNASALEAIKSGDSLVQATVAQQPTVMGYKVVEAALKAINGEAVEQTIAADVKVVNASNVNE